MLAKHSPGLSSQKEGYKEDKQSVKKNDDDEEKRRGEEEKSQKKTSLRWQKNLIFEIL